MSLKSLLRGHLLREARPDHPTEKCNHSSLQPPKQALLLSWMAQRILYYLPYSVVFPLAQMLVLQGSNICVSDLLSDPKSLEQTKRHLQDASPHDSRIHIILKCTRNILQDGPRVKPLKKPP